MRKYELVGHVNPYITGYVKKTEQQASGGREYRAGKTFKYQGYAVQAEEETFDQPYSSDANTQTFS